MPPLRFPKTPTAIFQCLEEPAASAGCCRMKTQPRLCRRFLQEIQYDSIGTWEVQPFDASSVQSETTDASSVHSDLFSTKGGCSSLFHAPEACQHPATMTQEEGKAYFSQKKYKEVRSLHIDIPMTLLPRQSSAKLSRE